MIETMVLEKLVERTLADNRDKTEKLRRA